MPVETRIRPAFAAIVKTILGDDTFGQASQKCGISKAYILSMVNTGLVPSEAIVQKIVSGYRLDAERAQGLMIAAGHSEADQPRALIPAIEQALPPVSDITPERKAKIMTMIVAMRSARHESAIDAMVRAVDNILKEEEAEDNRESGADA